MARRSDEMTARELQLNALYDSGRCARPGFPHLFANTANSAFTLLGWTLTFRKPPQCRWRVLHAARGLVADA
jgi:hypothetical protein